jgi:IS605 OrfB family transposase
MTKRKKDATEEVFTQVIPVVSCADEAQIDQLMHLCGIPRALTYNKLGSLQGWGRHWMGSDSIVRGLMKPKDIGLPAKLWEWSVNDTMKAIGAQQDAAKVFIGRAIWQRYPLTVDEKNRKDLLKDLSKKEASEYCFAPITFTEFERCRMFGLMHSDPTSDPWLHRTFRNQYQRGHTFVRNQVVYQSNGYNCKRLTRNTVLLEVAGIKSGKRIALKLKCRHVLHGQIRLIRNEQGCLEVHTIRRRPIIKIAATPTKLIGVDKGYTEGFYTSDGETIAAGLGKLLTQKTNRITRTNRNRYRLRCHAANNPQKAATILKNNLGYKVKSKRLQQEKATIKNFIRRDLRRVITEPTVIFAEDLTSPIKGKHQAKQISRKLNQWMKGELQQSLESVAKETGSIVKTINPAYTSQIDHLTGTLLGQRDGDRFISITGVVYQADCNAATNILHRGSDSEITRWMKYAEVRKALLLRTIRYLASVNKTVTDALKLKWLASKFKAEALELEALVSPSGVEGMVKLRCVGECQPLEIAPNSHHKRMKPAILDTPTQLCLDLHRVS